VTNKPDKPAFLNAKISQIFYLTSYYTHDVIENVMTKKNLPKNSPCLPPHKTRVESALATVVEVYLLYVLRYYCTRTGVSTINDHFFSHEFFPSIVVHF
jgi:hypothetical protein